MSYRDILLATGTPKREIPLSTHLGTGIKNETMSPEFKPTPSQRKAEERLGVMYRRIRDPIAGFNCFGQVFANRRTGIYGKIDDVDLEQILSEDGYLEISESELHEGDVVMYYDERGPTHATRVWRFEEIRLDPKALPTRRVLALSKFNDMSGEYEHSIEDIRWASYTDQVTRRIFRDRGQSPKSKAPVGTGWRAIVVSSNG